MNALDILIKDLIGEALKDIRARPQLIDEIFQELAPTTRLEIKQYMAAAKVHVRLGWAMGTAILPEIAVILPGEQETAQYLGSDVPMTWDEESGSLVDPSYIEGGIYHEAQIAQFSGAINAAVYGLNPNEAAWLSSIVKWIMLRYRPRMEQFGLVEQRVSRSDFMPSDEYPQPDQCYTRVVTMQYTCFTNYTIEHSDADDLVVPHTLGVELTEIDE